MAVSFLSKAREVWGDRWDYSNTKYVRATQPIIIECPKHGPFSQVPSSHLRGNVGCRQCSSWKMSPEDFLNRATQVWGDRWDYSLVHYINTSTKVKILCPLHGEFEQTPKKHLLGSVGCPRCNGQRMDTSLFISKAKKVWGDRWDYSKVTYQRSSQPVRIVCPDHGEFEQRPNNHLSGSVGCRGCNVGTSGTRVTTEEFIEHATQVWGDRWDYSTTSYTDSKSPLAVTCPDHGEFVQPADSLLAGRIGCKACQPVGTSAGEDSLAQFIGSLVPIERNVRGLIPESKTEVDVYVPSLGTAFEFNGLYWHSELYRPADYHYSKYLMALEQGITLIQVWEDDWNLRRSQVEEHIRQVLSKSTLPKISARETVGAEIPHAQARAFLETYHIQGFAPATVHTGLFLKDTLVAVASFRRDGSNFTLTRYATSANVRGGHSKLIRYFEKNYNYRTLITFADLTFGSGELYQKTGWIEDSLLAPDYSYVFKGRRHHKFGFRLSKFKNSPTLKFSEGYTEKELAQLNGLVRVYDAGKIRFIKPHPAEGL